jgi:acyl-CoA synthetase (NDP forming)
VNLEEEWILSEGDHFLERFFAPRSVAVVGATNNVFKINYCLVQNLVRLNYPGKIYPVNTRERDIGGLRAFARLTDIPDAIDLVVISVPATKTMEVVKECDTIGVKNVVIVTGGFSEAGEHGKKLHREMALFIKKRGIRVIGPNTLSPINTSNNFSISFNPIRKMRRGGISFVFQSGFYEPKINWLFSHLGLSKLIDLGNKIDVNEVDALEYFLRDPDTKLIAMHIETLQGDGRMFFDLIRKGAAKKPIIILKSGRTPAGSLAAASHTGAIARENDGIFDGLLKQTAAVRALNWEEFFDLTKAFEYLPIPGGKRIAIVTLSGGEGVMATDACEMNGLEIARLGGRTYKRLKRIFPPWEIPLNPLDVGACLEFHLSDVVTVIEALAAVPEDDNVDCAVMQMPPEFFHEGPEGVNSSAQKGDSLRQQCTQAFLKLKDRGKPFALWRTSMGRNEDEWIEQLESHCLPVFPSSERAIKALASLYKYRTFLGNEGVGE